MKLKYTFLCISCGMGIKHTFQKYISAFFFTYFPIFPFYIKQKWKHFKAYLPFFQILVYVPPLNLTSHILVLNFDFRETQQLLLCGIKYFFYEMLSLSNTKLNYVFSWRMLFSPFHLRHFLFLKFFQLFAFLWHFCDCIKDSLLIKVIWMQNWAFRRELLFILERVCLFLW